MEGTFYVVFMLLLSNTPADLAANSFRTLETSIKFLEMADITGAGDSNKLSPELPNHNLLVPSPIVTRRTRTLSTCARAGENQETGKVKAFCRSKGHGFITPDCGGSDIFVHISDIEGEYVPLPGDQVQYKLCPIPPKFEKHQAIHVNIINFTPEVHFKWDCPNGDDN